MTTTALAILKIQQIDNTHFDVLWSDQTLKRYRLSEIQKSCPCALCTENTIVDDDVRAKRIKSVGRYALQVEFSSGCSNGIYNYDDLYSLGQSL